MDIIISLPTALSSTILAEWLEITDTARLDTAFCQKAKRAAYLTVLKSSDCAYRLPERVLNENSTALEHWILKKGMKVSNVQFSNHTDLDLFTAFMDHTGRKLTTVAFEEIQDSIYFEFMIKEVVKRSPALANLQLYICKCTNEMWGIFDHLPNLTSLTLCVTEDAPFLPPPGASRGCCPLLRFVSLAGNGIEDSAALALVELAPPGNILQLGMHRLSASDATLERIARHCPALQVLTLSYMDMGSHIFARVVELCPLIQHLDASCTINLEDEDFAPVIEKLKLQTLVVDYNNLSDATVELIIEYQQSTLQALFVSNCDHISPLGLIRLVLGCTRLHTLSVGGMQSAKEMFSETLFDAAHRLKTLLLSGVINNACVSLVAKHCTKLQRFGVLTDCNVDKSLLQVVQSCKNLRALHVPKMKSYFSKKCKDINPALVIQKVENNLHEFDILSMSYEF